MPKSKMDESLLPVHCHDPYTYARRAANVADGQTTKGRSRTFKFSPHVLINFIYKPVGAGGGGLCRRKAENGRGEKE